MLLGAGIGGPKEETRVFLHIAKGALQAQRSGIKCLCLAEEASMHQLCPNVLVQLDCLIQGSL